LQKAKNVPGSYHDSGEWEILKMNWDLLYKRVVEADAVPGSPPTKEHIGQVGATVFEILHLQLLRQLLLLKRLVVKCLLWYRT
jgi:hypothetical protein